jgi:hypothetical protein
MYPVASVYDIIRQSRYLTRNYLFTCKHYTRLYIHNMFRLQCAIQDGNALELFALDLHYARTHRKNGTLLLKNIEILILASKNICILITF